MPHVAPSTDHVPVQYPTLELSLHPVGAELYSLEPRFYEPGRSYGPRLFEGAIPQVRLSTAKLLELSQNTKAYGQQLAAMVFADERVGRALVRAEAMAAARELPLCLRLRLDQVDTAIHDLSWELLCDPVRGDFLCTREQLLVTRYIENPHSHRLEGRPRAGLHALIAIASPLNLDQYGLCPIPVAGEVETAREALGDIGVEALVTGAIPGRATFKGIVDSLRRRPDILYVVCHGAVVDEEMFLFLEQENGMVGALPGDAFVACIRDLRQPPSLVVLASCQSADMALPDKLMSALGPRLVEAGCAAVIAMRGKVSASTSRRFFQSFFQCLRADGHVDLALAAARSACQQFDDWWRPVLYSGRPDGRLWPPNTPGRVFSGVPAQNRHYVPRQQEEQQVVAGLSDEADATTVTVVRGEHGIGKSTLVTELLHRLRREGRLSGAVIWLDLSRLTPEEQLGSILITLGEQRIRTGEVLTELRKLIWEQIRQEQHPFFLVLDNADEVGDLGLLLPGPGSLPVNCRLIVIGAGSPRLPSGYRTREVTLGALSPGHVEALFAAILGSRFVEQFAKEIRRIGLVLEGQPQIVALVALELCQTGEHPAAFLARLEQAEQRLDLRVTEQERRVELTLQSLSDGDAQLFNLLAVLGDGDWDAALLAGVALCSESEAAEALQRLVERGLVSAAQGGRYSANRLVRSQARSRFERLPTQERHIAEYLFTRACLDRTQDVYASAAGEHDGATSLARFLSPIAVLVQRFRRLILPDLGHVRRALVLAHQHQEWKLLQRFAQLAYAELLDELWANAGVVQGALLMARLVRPVFWAVGDEVKVHISAALVSHPLTFRHEGARRPLVIEDGYSHAERLSWPLIGPPVPRESGGVPPELLLHLTASVVVEGMIRGYTLVEAQWSGVIADNLLLCDVDTIGTAWSYCDLKQSVWIRCDARTMSLLQCNLRRAVMERVCLRGANLAGSNLEEAYLIDVDLRGADLAQVNLTGATLIRVNMSGANLTGASLKGAHLDQVTINRARLHNSVWHGSVGRPADDELENLEYILAQQETLSDQRPPSRQRRPSSEMFAQHPYGHKQSDLRAILLQGMRFDAVSPEPLDLSGANLRGASLAGFSATMVRLKGVNLRAADLSGADLSGADLSGALLDGAWLKRAVLREASLQNARLRGASLEGAQLQQVGLEGADLTGADLRGVDLSSADIAGTIMAGADLRGAIVEPHQLASVARLDEALIEEDGVEVDIALLRGVYSDSPTGFGPRTHLRFSHCAGRFERWPFRGCDFFGAKLSGEFREVDFAQGSGPCAMLSGVFWSVRFEEVDLSGSTLSGTFAKARFERCNLADARLTGFFVNASFEGARLERASLRGASLVNVDLSQTSGLSVEQLATAHRLRGSTLPNGELYDGSLDLSGDREDACLHSVDPDDPEAMARFCMRTADTREVLMLSG